MVDVAQINVLSARWIKPPGAPPQGSRFTARPPQDPQSQDLVWALPLAPKVSPEMAPSSNSFCCLIIIAIKGDNGQLEEPHAATPRDAPRRF
ncbi:unnamed protein product [Gadus morhua 'NCC']